MRHFAAAPLAILICSCGSTTGPLMESHTAWRNEPAGFSALTDQPWNALTGGGWNRRDSSDDRIVTDPTAPLSPAGVLEYVYPIGFEGGIPPGTHYYPLNNKKELFVGLEWKVSDPWQGHASNVNKIQFIYGSSDVAMVMYGPNNGPYELRVMPQWPEHNGSWLTPNVNNPAVMLGRWHRIEWYLKYETAYRAGDGIIRWWLDGALVGNYTKVRYPHDAGFVEYQMSPTWGGVGDVKTETDHYWFDHSYISSPSNITPSPPNTILFRESGAPTAFITRRDLKSGKANVLACTMDKHTSGACLAAYAGVRTERSRVVPGRAATLYMPTARAISVYKISE